MPAATRARDLADHDVRPAVEPRAVAGSVAEARRQELEALRRYRALVLAELDALRRAERRYRAASEAIDRHIRAVLAALAGDGDLHHAWVAATRAAQAAPGGAPDTAPAR